MTDRFNAMIDQKKEIADPASGARQFLTFTVEREEYGVDIMCVREIKGWTDTTTLPNSPEAMRGVMNLRGIVIPIFDLRSWFGLGPTEVHGKSVVIIIAVAERTIGILVDAVSDILNAGGDQIKPPPSSKQSAKDQCVSGIITLENRMVVVLDAERLFEEEKLTQISPEAA